MSTVSGLPAHALLVHFIVVLAPMTALLAVLCALWPAALRRLVWLVLALAAAIAVVTPVTIRAGLWLVERVDRSEALESHEELGQTMVYFAIALFVAAILLLIVHLRRERGMSMHPVLTAAIAVMVLATAAATTVQTYRVGDSGAHAVWSDAFHND